MGTFELRLFIEHKFISDLKMHVFFNLQNDVRNSNACAMNFLHPFTNIHAL